MADDADGRVYYVISDLHIGGDEQLGEVDFLEELIAFLERLETTDEDVELLINGDAFGLWEITEIDGLAKFDVLTDRYSGLFEQLRATGASIPVTMLPGNHDHDLAAYDEYVDRLAEYNVDLVQAESVTRPVGDRTIHFEHGHQQDPNNRFEDVGNRHETPLGYYYNALVTSRAGRLSERGRYNWLKDVQAVTPTERVPRWLLSKYFYREMNPLLRYAVLPFLLLLNVSVVLAVLAGLDVAGVWAMPVEMADAVLDQLGYVGETVHLLLVVNAAVAGILLLVGIPVYFVLRDFRQTVDRFGIFETDLTVDPDEPYKEAAREVFAAQPETAIFCYGHTHRPKVIDVDGRLLVNTGTWLKRLHRRDVAVGVLPPVFYPSYQLCAVRISAETAGVTVEYEEIEKSNPSPIEVTRTERLLTLGREPSSNLPDRSIVSDTASDTGSD
ncbi:metallophosphoesterase [Natronobacterium gregoryi]|uniref:Phosphoesterase n=3 Tax=Natronobacterium gregoryi TaxID=44930 RepID=L0AG85_NATGS|nr:metallophosphoesterase [Natronobacterium gregoryi]AFZ72152.1 putative phosphohydrolase [Natronobacterium gregoryi SP2]PLK20099.1 phosphoesterase [Natronobacterium gregoryi SP2]SFJ33307.1 Calcineurin-like phosphoesterase superfamily domain-containing protein [Natronobacterium gregoryi]